MIAEIPNKRGGLGTGFPAPSAKLRLLEVLFVRGDEGDSLKGFGLISQVRLVFGKPISAQQRAFHHGLGNVGRSGPSAIRPNERSDKGASTGLTDPLGRRPHSLANMIKGILPSLAKPDEQDAFGRHRAMGMQEDRLLAFPLELPTLP